MNYLKIISLSIILFFLFTVQTLAANTYYVRSDGGDSQQCTGLVNAPYSGSGTNQPCAWSHPFWALRIEGGEPQWRLSPGDIVIIGSGSYMMGYGAPNTTWCNSASAYDCVLPPLPNNVQILGEGWDTGCSNPPELWATERAWQIFDLSGSSGITLACLELTDHGSCVYEHANPQVRCEYNQPPFGAWGYRGILIRDSNNVTLRDLNIHGFASEGIMAGRLQNITLERVRIAGNGWTGWNGDLWGEPSSNHGDLIFRNLIIEWNGCVETYPSKEFTHCWAQSAGGYGDGFGTAATGGNWVFEDCIFRYNTSDGLDLLYVVVSDNSFIRLNRIKAYGNAGNQLKVGGPTVITNTLAIGNCNYFTGQSFAQEMGDVDSGDACRAGGATISINMKPDDRSAIINSSIVTEGWAQVEVYCGTHDFPDEALPCKGSEILYMVNNIFLGFPNVTRAGDWPDLVGDGDPERRTRTESIDYNIIYNTQVSEIGLSIGSHNIFANPMFISASDINQIDAHLQADSPAINAGVSVGTVFGLGQVPNHDLDGVSRPIGGFVDLGAYEVGGQVCVPPFSDLSCDHWAINYIQWIKERGITTGYPDGTFRPEQTVKRSEMAAFIIRTLDGENFSYPSTPYFMDVTPGMWHFKYVQRLRERGLTTGCNSEGNMYCPEGTVKREQMAAFLVRAKVGESFSYSMTPYFPDVPASHWAFKYVQKLREMGITTGYPDGTFKPDNGVTRAEMATFLYRAFGR